MTHGWPTTAAGVSPPLAPCGLAIRLGLDGFTRAERFIDCRECMRLGRAGAFGMIPVAGQMRLAL